SYSLSPTLEFCHPRSSLVFLPCSSAHLDLHSFPTRRSSDLSPLTARPLALVAALIVQPGMHSMPVVLVMGRPRRMRLPTTAHPELRVDRPTHRLPHLIAHRTPPRTMSSRRRHNGTGTTRPSR